MSISTANISVIGFGDLLWDTTFETQSGVIEKFNLAKGNSQLANDRKIVEDAKKMALENCSSCKETAGGSASNALKVIARLCDGIVTLCAMVAKDSTGSKAEKRLNQLGINLLKVSSADVDQYDGTGIVNSFITREKDGKVERTMQVFLDIATKYYDSCIKPEHFADRKFVILDGYNIYHDRMLAKCIKLAKENGCKTVMGLPSPVPVTMFRGHFKKYAGDVDFCFGNREEFEALTTSNDPHTILGQFKPHQTVVITDGENGCYVKWSGSDKMRHFKALYVDKVVDTTGAGDFFAGGVMAGVIAGKTEDASIQLGLLAASYVIQELGADLPNEKWEEFAKQAETI